MTPATLKAWRLRLKSERGRRAVSQQEAADRLGIGLATYRNYEAGVRSDGYPVKIPHAVALACAALERGLPPIS